MHSVSPQTHFPATRPHIPKKRLAVVFVNGKTVHQYISGQAGLQHIPRRHQITQKRADGYA